MKSAAAISLRAELAFLADSDGFIDLSVGKCVIIRAVTIAAALICVGMAYRSTRKLEKRLEEEEKAAGRSKAKSKSKSKGKKNGKRK